MNNDTIMSSWCEVKALKNPAFVDDIRISPFTSSSSLRVLLLYEKFFMGHETSGTSSSNYEL